MLLVVVEKHFFGGGKAFHALGYDAREALDASNINRKYINPDHFRDNTDRN